jgi:hypothetical protein
LKTQVELRVGCRDDLTVKSLASVLAPDNEGAPRGMKLVSAVEADGLKFTVDSDSASSSLSTALAVLRDATLFEEVWLLSQPKQG